MWYGKSGKFLRKYCQLVLLGLLVIVTYKVPIHGGGLQSPARTLWLLGVTVLVLFSYTLHTITSLDFTPLTQTTYTVQGIVAFLQFFTKYLL